MIVRMIADNHADNPRYKQSSFVDGLTQIISSMQSQDFIYLENMFNRNDQQFLKELYYILHHWDTFKPSLHTTFLSLLWLLNHKFKPSFTIQDNNSIKQLLFPYLCGLQDKIQKLCKNGNSQQNNKIVEGSICWNKDDQRLVMRCLQLQNKNKIKVAIQNHEISSQNKLDKKEKQLKQQSKMLLSLSQMRLFTKFQASLNYKKALHNNSESSAKLERNNDVNQIQYERLISLRCLGCCQFFYSGLNIFDPQITETPLVLLQGISKIQELQNNFRNEVCYLLNNNGGVILFDCKKVDEHVVPVGQYFTNIQIAQTQQRIYNYIQFIYPKPSVPHHVQLTFVPLLDLSHGRNISIDRPALKKRIDNTYEMNYFQRPFVQGMYVARIKIIPTEGQKCYFWVNDQKPIFPIKAEGNQSISALPPKSIRKYIKNKFKLYYIPENDANRQELKFIQPRVSHFHKGDCKKPEQGKTTSFIKRSKQNEPKTKQFHYMSILLAKKTNLPTIKQNLTKLKLKFEIESRFQRSKLKAQALSSILHHEIRFDELLRIIQQPQFVFKDKRSSVILVTCLIKLMNRNAINSFSVQDYQSLCKWLQLQFPEEKLRVWSYLNEKKQYQLYIQSQSKYSMVLMFYVLNSYNEMAHFRNPQNFDRLTPDDLSTKFKLVYPKGQSVQAMPLTYIPLNHNTFGISLNRQNLLATMQQQEGPCHLQQDLGCNIEMKQSVWRLQYEKMTSEQMIEGQQ